MWPASGQVAGTMESREGMWYKLKVFFFLFTSKCPVCTDFFRPADGTKFFVLVD